jgi:uncharacterized membrane protein
VSDRRFSARTVIARNPAAVFAWVADYRNVPTVLEGVERWEPLGRRTTGEGARFAVTMRVFGQELEDVLVLDTWDEPWAIGWRSASGSGGHSGDWRFRPRVDGTEVTLTISYRVPGGVLGGLVAGPLVGALRTRLEQALDRMRVSLETASAR